eukprot:jgi/Botrbrau1/23586/Bobra.0141s0050.1
MLYLRTLLGMDGPGLSYVRKSIMKQAERVREGGAVRHPDPARQQALVEGYLKPLRAHDWDRGVLYAFRSFSFKPSSRFPYEHLTCPVQIILGDREMSMLKNATEHVVEELRDRPVGQHRGGGAGGLRARADGRPAIRIGGGHPKLRPGIPRGLACGCNASAGHRPELWVGARPCWLPGDHRAGNAGRGLG